jgi:hypothetical protein
MTAVPAVRATPRAGTNAPSSGAALSAPDALSLTDLTRLVREGVGAPVVVRQIRRLGVDFEPTVEALLRLRRAGAPDEILDAVLDATESSAGASRRSTDRDAAPGDPPRKSRGDDAARRGDDRVTVRSSEAGEDGGPPVRMFEGSDVHGRPTLVLTNLDEEGRRIGGEAATHQEPNIVLAPDPAPPRRAARTDRRGGRPPAETGEYERVTPGTDEPHEADARTPGEGVSPVTVIIQNGAAAPQVPAVAPAQYPATCGGVYPWSGCGVVATGGIVGGFKYPDKLFFLGYDPRNSLTLATTALPPRADLPIAQPPPKSER